MDSLLLRLMKAFDMIDVAKNRIAEDARMMRSVSDRVLRAMEISDREELTERDRRRALDLTAINKGFEEADEALGKALKVWMDQEHRVREWFNDCDSR